MKEKREGICQLKYIHQLGEYSRSNKFFEDLRWKVRHVKSKAIRLKGKVLPRGNSSVLSVLVSPRSVAAINPGDLVRIRSREEVRKMLDQHGVYKGCTFQPDMYDYCGKIRKVSKRVDYFYDEVKEKLCKCRNLFILEGVYCTGKKRLYKDRCDLNCYPFWHKDWLERV